MSISLNCRCGRKLTVNEELAGRKIRCQLCEAVLTVPRREAAASAQEPILDVLPADEATDSQPAGQAAGAEADDVATAELAYPPVRRRPGLPDSPQPRRRRRRPSFHVSVPFDPVAVLGGAAAVLVGLILLVVGFQARVVFFAAPALIITGIAAIIKGLMNSD
jgi:hypothetical protein